MDMTTLTIQGVSLTSRITTQPLLNVTELTLQPGVLYGLAGENFSGCSALLRTISQTLEYQVLAGEQGSVKLSSSTASRDVTAQDASLIGPDPFACLSAITDTVADELELYDASGKSTRLLSRFGLDAVVFNDPLALSGGQAALLAITLVLCSDAQILCIDNTLEQISPDVRRKVWDELLNSARAGKFVFVTDKDPDTLSEFPHQIILMIDHAPAFVGPAADAFHHALSHELSCIPTALSIGVELGLDSPPVHLKDLIRRIKELR